MRVTGKIWRRLTAAARLPPGFLIIGAQKSGTTALFQHLLAHPLVLRPRRKEVHYFDFRYRLGPGWYRAHFPLWRPGAWMTFEKSPSYMLHPLAATRAAAFNPHLKLIAILRDPVERALSHHAMKVRRGHEPLGFEEAVEAEPERMSGFEAAIDTAPDNRRSSARRYSYLKRGLYAEQLEAWLAHFPRENLLVLRTEDMRADGNRTLNRAFAFLGLPPHRLPLGEFMGQRRHAIDPALRKRLQSHFADDQAGSHRCSTTSGRAGMSAARPARTRRPPPDHDMPGSRPPRSLPLPAPSGAGPRLAIVQMAPRRTRPGDVYSGSLIQGPPSDRQAAFAAPGASCGGSSKDGRWSSNHPSPISNGSSRSRAGTLFLLELIHAAQYR